MNKRQTGGRKEILAAEFLQKKGFVILVHNFYFRNGEIDLIAKEGQCLCFIEVKYRTSLRCGAPIEAISPLKQKRMQLGAQYYMFTHKIPFDTPCRFDAVSILKDEITLQRNIF